MKRYTNVDDIKRRAADDNITAEELDILVSSTRELSAQRERELNQLNKLLDDLEGRLGDVFER
ncbi:MAG TPA: hypothetical protein VL027_13940 [Spongiibacteraceae bacterium]|jgi:hypothetical protein|nr:hypothetical protein [Spongiibacteraceae bacterium]HUH39039.1 hypothetical protein [Spongiibacteraceae bacterium]